MIAFHVFLGGRGALLRGARECDKMPKSNCWPRMALKSKQMFYTET